jgi:type IV pilus assembly protein PilX
MSMDNIKTPRRQHGSVLAVSLFILVILTIIGVSSMVSTTLEEKMSGNFRDRQMAFNAAETALAYAEDFVNTNINAASVFDDTNGYYSPNNGPGSNDVFDVATWWNSDADSIEYPLTISYVNTKPRYTIEYRGDVGEEEGTSIGIGGYGESTGGGQISSFRITVRATGLTDNSVVILQSYYGKRL